MRASILVINGHPDPGPQRFCAAIGERYAESIRLSGAEASQLNAGDWSLAGVRQASGSIAPELNSARQQFAVADCVTVIFPLWLGEAPTSLRVLLDAVCGGSSGIGPLAAARIIVTMDLPAFFYASTDRNSDCHRKQAPARLPHIVSEQLSLIGSVGALSAAGRERWLERIADLAARDAEHANRSKRRSAWTRRLGPLLRGWTPAFSERRFQPKQIAQI